MKKLFAGILFVSGICGLYAKEIKVKVVPGEQWSQRKPQCAVWICDENNNYVDTLFVTKSASEKAWKFSPKEGRPDSLPVWYGFAKVNPAKPKTAELDAVTGATPKAAIEASRNLKLEEGKSYIVYAEVNQSFDYNEKFTKKNSGVNGQPSVIYSERIEAGSSASKTSLKFAGTGSVSGADGNIHSDNKDFLTTAKNIIKDVIVSY